MSDYAVITDAPGYHGDLVSVHRAVRIGQRVRLERGQALYHQDDATVGVGDETERIERLCAGDRVPRVGWSKPTATGPCTVTA